LVMMAKKKDRKEGKGHTYSGRIPKAQGEGLEYKHEKIPDATPPPMSAGTKEKKKKKRSPLQLKVLAALEEFESENPQAEKKEEKTVKQGAGSAAHGAAQREKQKAAKMAKKAALEEAQEKFLQQKREADEAAAEELRRSPRNLFAEISPRYRAAKRGDGDEEQETMMDEADEVEDDSIETQTLTEEEQRKRKARWYAGYFKPRDF
jgi:hypothetical protein